MIHPCRLCHESNLPGCRSGCASLQAWNDLREMERKDHEREMLLNGYVCDACRQAKRGGRRHDGRMIR